GAGHVPLDDDLLVLPAEKNQAGPCGGGDRHEQDRCPTDKRPVPPHPAPRSGGEWLVPGHHRIVRPPPPHLVRQRPRPGTAGRRLAPWARHSGPPACAPSP